jgi:hypothetical protein
MVFGSVVTACRRVPLGLPARRHSTTRTAIEPNLAGLDDIGYGVAASEGLALNWRWGWNRVGRVEALRAPYHDIARRIDADSDAVVFDIEHREGDVVADDHRLRSTSSQDEHALPPINIIVSRHYRVQRSIV